jgi:hypothetical protein
MNDGPGFRTELLIAEAMKSQGWHLAHAPVVDRKSTRDNVAPLVEGENDASRMPDILAQRDGSTLWAEVKYKETGAEWITKNEQYEHFIDRPAWQDYYEVHRQGDCDVWIFVLEGDTNTLQRQLIENIDVVGNWTEADVKRKNGSVYGNPGVFIPQDDFIPLALQSGFAPENFFGQDRLSLAEIPAEIVPQHRHGGYSTPDVEEAKQQSGLDDWVTGGGTDD